MPVLPTANFPLLPVNSRHLSPNLCLTVTNDRYFADHPLLSLVDRCTKSSQLKQIHAQLLRTGLFFDPYSSSKLFSALAISPLSNLSYAQKVFDEIPQPNLYTWNTLIRAYASTDDPFLSLFFFSRMLHECPEFPDKFTFPFVIKAASEVVVDDAKLGRAIHGMAVKLGLALDLYILNSLLRFYAACGCLDVAYRVFLRIPNKDVVSWNTMIMGYVQGCYPEMALELYQAMEGENVRPNEVTMVGVFCACSKIGNLEFARMAHLRMRKNKIELNLTLNNAILDMYMKCGSVEDAKKLFDEMQEKDVVSWTTMLVGYAKVGKFMEACHVFHAMPYRDIAAWNALISAYEQNGKSKEALNVFQQLLANKSPKPDEVTLVCALSACAQLGAADSGSWIHVYIKKQGIKLNSHLSTSLIDMYSKCGDLERALKVFSTAKKKDVFVWSAMIAGLAMHGHGRAAIDIFSRMQNARVKPNAVTFINVLSACSHMGYVEEGRSFFKQMQPVYGVKPQAEHYSCMVDILGRAGLFGEAMDVIKEMAVPYTPSVWLSLLGACCLHVNVGLAELAASRLLELEPENDGAYVLLSNVYAKCGSWTKVAELRKLMKDFGLKKEPGYSSIEVNGIVHNFLVADNSHPMSREIYTKLNEIVSKLKTDGYVLNEKHILQVVDEENMKEQALCVHSEKLAIAFGLLSLAPPQPIRIVKNLRVCEDCHAFAKIISRVYNRKILLRDRSRFHYFKGGLCSCMEYW